MLESGENIFVGGCENYENYKIDERLKVRQEFLIEDVYMDGSDELSDMTRNQRQIIEEIRTKTPSPA